MENPTITIVMNQDGSIRLQANIDNPVILYGMLGRAKDAVKDGIDEKSRQGRVLAASAGALKQLEGVK